MGVAMLLVFLLHAAKVVNIPLIQHIEAISYDARLQLTMPKTLDRRIVIVDIDEKSLAEEGRWPWGRDKLAAMLDRLFDQYHVAVVGFDVVFAEKDESSGLKVAGAAQPERAEKSPAVPGKPGAVAPAAGPRPHLRPQTGIPPGGAGLLLHQQ